MADTTATVENVGNLKDVLDFISVHPNKIDLKRIQDAAYQRRQDIAVKESDEFNWYIGMPVTIKPEYVQKGLGGVIGHIDKINPKKLIIDFGTGRSFNVPKYMAEAATENAS